MVADEKPRTTMCIDCSASLTIFPSVKMIIGKFKKQNKNLAFDKYKQCCIS